MLFLHNWLCHYSIRGHEIESGGGTFLKNYLKNPEIFNCDALAEMLIAAASGLEDRGFEYRQGIRF
jgi:hypothetical protein